MTDADEVRRLLDYDQHTGRFKWRVSPSNNVQAGSDAGCINPATGYVDIKIGNRVHKAHRLAMLWMNGTIRKPCVDHIDGNKSNNAFLNLREATVSQNQQNRVDATSRSNSGYLGVSFHQASGKYRAMIKADGKNKWLGCFESAEAARDAYQFAKAQLHEYARPKHATAL